MPRKRRQHAAQSAEPKRLARDLVASATALVADAACVYSVGARCIDQQVTSPPFQVLPCLLSCAFSFALMALTRLAGRRLRESRQSGLRARLLAAAPLVALMLLVVFLCTSSAAAGGDVNFDGVFKLLSAAAAAIAHGVIATRSPARRRHARKRARATSRGPHHSTQSRAVRPAHLR